MSQRLQWGRLAPVALLIWVIALIPRVYGLGGFITVDEIKWIEGAGQFTNALLSGQLAQTYWHFFPGITTSWGEALLLLLGWRLHGGEPAAYIAALLADPANSIGFFRLPGAILTSVIPPLVFLAARRFFNDWSAALAGLFIALNPFFLAHSRLVNGDALAAGLMLLSLLAFLRLFQRPSMAHGIISGVFCGLALLTKLPSPLIIPCIFLLALIGGIADRSRRRFWVKAFLCWCLAAALTFIVLFPAMWVNPFGTIQNLAHDTFAVGEAEEGHSAFFLGQVSNDPGWGFYPYAVAFRLTPLCLLGLLLLLVGFFRPGKNQPREQWLAMWTLLAYVLLVYLFGNLSPKKLDRYLMAVIPAIDVLAAAGFGMLLKTVPVHWLAVRSNLLPALVWTGLGGLLAVAWVIPNYPYYLGYYNPLMGGISTAVGQVPVGWGEGLEKGAEWLNSQPDAAALRVSAWYSDSFFPFFHGKRISFSSSGKSQLTADYVVFYINQVQRQNPSQELISYFQRQTPSFVYNLGGAPITWVYRAPKMQYALPKQSKIEGKAELLGFSFKPASDQPSQTVEVELFLQLTGNLRPEESYKIELLDATGAEGAAAFIRPEMNSPGVIEQLSASLPLAAGTPAGNYRLGLSLWNTQTKTEIGRFTIPGDALTLNIGADAK